MAYFPRARPLTLALAALGAAGLTACGDGAAPNLQDSVKNVVVIYAENRSFDSLFGKFPGANGLGAVLNADGSTTSAYIPQKDRDGTLLATLPPTWGGVTAPGVTPVVTQAQSAGLPNAPFSIETAFKTSANAVLTTATVTRDLIHAFFEHQMQINGGKNDMFAAWSNAGGLVMGTFDYSHSPMFKLAQQYVLADNFFQGAYGGSFLNHQYLICACAPEYPNAATAAAAPTIATLNLDANGKYLPSLATRTASPASPASAMTGVPTFAGYGNLTPANYFGDGKYYAVNTMQPPYQPSGNKPTGVSGNDALYADTTKPNSLPAQTATTIGDLLSAKNVSWKWYGGAWNSAVTDGIQAPSATRNVIYASNSYGIASTSNIDFQAHHQPFNYYSNFDPVTQAANRAAHLKDYTDLVADAATGKLPAVTFYKPEGLYNHHPGYTNLDEGDTKVADLISKLQASPQWKNMVIVVTYDEFGGQWDHVAPPKGDLLGPGTRIPALVISPMAKKGTVDHTQYDTASVLRLITRVFDLPTLPGVAARDAALKTHGAAPMGDLTKALDL